MSIESRELALFIENDGGLYRQMTTPIINSIKRFKRKGTYNEGLALKAFKRLTDVGARQYNRDLSGNVERNLK